jgi:pyruvate/2-oxoglutarate dehydrogenase complex dihydrolipoamide dehydrogenase (E3) component
MGKFPFMANSKVLCQGKTGGFAKLTNSQNGKILGSYLINPEVSELLLELSLAW